MSCPVATSLPPHHQDRRLVKNTELLKRGEAALQKSLAVLTDALDESDKVKEAVAKVSGGEPEEWHNNLRTLEKAKRRLSELDSAAKDQGYVSPEKALDALRRTNSDRLVGLPRFLTSVPPHWTTTWGLSETRATTLLRATQRVARKLLQEDPEWFEAAPHVKRHFHTDSPEEFLAVLREEEFALSEPELAEELEKEREEALRTPKFTRSDLYRQVSHHLRPRFATEADWQLFQTFEDSTPYPADRVVDLDTQLNSGGDLANQCAGQLLEPTLFALAGFEHTEWRRLQYDGELPQGAAVLKALSMGLPTTKEDWLTASGEALLTY